MVGMSHFSSLQTAIFILKIAVLSANMFTAVVYGMNVFPTHIWERAVNQLQAILLLSICRRQSMEAHSIEVRSQECKGRVTMRGRTGKKRNQHDKRPCHIVKVSDDGHSQVPLLNTKNRRENLKQGNKLGWIFLFFYTSVPHVVTHSFSDNLYDCSPTG